MNNEMFETEQIQTSLPSTPLTIPMLHVSSLNVYYGESHILRDVDLSVPPGEMVCLIGRNGVGKTTLLKSIMGQRAFWHPHN